MVKNILKIVGTVICLVFIWSLSREIGNHDLDPLSEEARAIRQQQLIEATPQQKREIVTEVLAGDCIVSGTIVDDGIRNGLAVEGGVGFSFFEANEGFKYTGFYLDVSDWIVKNKLGEEYGVHWRIDPNVVSAEITYTIEGKDPVTLTFDTKEIFAWKQPYADFTYSVRDLDANGNEVGNYYFESEHINHRILLDKTMYANTGVTCDPVPDEEISGVTADFGVNPSNIPTKDKQSNFGIRQPYKIEEDHLKIRVWDQWYVFKKLWEVEIAASEIREDGMTLMCSHRGSGIASDFHMKDSYRIEKKTEAGWEEVSPIAEIGWKGEEYFIPENGAIELDISWEDVYGEFSSGKYRVVKELYWYDRTEGEYVTTTCYSEFEI